MAAPTAIRETTNLLVKLLRLRLARDNDDEMLNEEQIQPVPPTAVDDESRVRLTIYLFGVSKSGSLNTETTQISENRKEKSPLGLELRYLLMAFPSGEDGRDGVLDQHQLLGQAMQTLYDAETIEPEELPDALGDQRLTVTLEQRDPTELTDLWTTFPELPLHPSATYAVRPVRIPSTQSTPFERVSERDVQVSRGPESEADGTDEDGEKSDTDERDSGS
ncbi:Pvc16 family protein [Halopiger djelfimassiliensis]|uniref:Pvc16 family protein n=1 Tax=Halopiger djelfimassiliensis TaxID=1293047 RepID=UPI000677A48F|nr:Pvc16 family protein [Halopiger djelfimassiliensis]